ncbi:MAG: SIS domain-containing protein [Candidatus Aramenus sp.]|jgi:fructoselysine-6-P-deglycase FrlB-like protein|nr:SIS domain-containing protein [Candidatus Aramenus sp.]
MDYVKLMEEELNANYRVKADIQLEEAYVTGAGDSYAVSLTIQEKTGGRFRAVDPYDAINYRIDKPLVVVSVSGRPKSNVILAKRLRGKVKVIAVTSNLDSELAKVADHVVHLPYKPKATLPGTLSFLMSLSAVYSIANAEEDKGQGDEVPLSHPFFVGKGENFGIAYFAYLKMAEVFGERSGYERLEQFCHSPIFSSRGSTLVLLTSGDERERELANLIDFTGVYSTRCKGAFCNAKAIIRSVVSEMKKRNWNRVYFTEDSKILAISSRMIYDEGARP